VGEPAPDARAAVEGAEVVVSAGPIVERPDPPLSPGWLGGSWLALPVDFDFYFRAETIAAAGLFLVDDVAQFEYYRGRGHFRGWPEPHGSVGEALGHRAAAARVACVNLGVGALDAAFAQRVLDEARARGAGTPLPR
jgi:ornithine cyclodeaminase/alanine dehydrogenase